MIFLEILLAKHIFKNNWSYAEGYLCQKFKMELLAKIVDDFHPLSIIAKSSFVNIWKGSQYTCYNSKNSFRKKPVMESILAHSKSADLLKQIPSQMFSWEVFRTTNLGLTLVVVMKSCNFLGFFVTRTFKICYSNFHCWFYDWGKQIFSV